MGCVCVKDNTESELVLNDKNKNLRSFEKRGHRLCKSPFARVYRLCLCGKKRAEGFKGSCLPA